MYRCGGCSGHTDCLSYRVIAVDEAGNESAPGYADTPTATQCPKTPAAPTNLQASTVSGCGTRLEWDASTTGATEYYVYRTVIQPQAYYFYDTKHIVGVGGLPPVNYYTEMGDTQSNPGGEITCEDSNCGISTWTNGQCSQGYLAAYYVTARGPSGGESPRSSA